MVNSLRTWLNCQDASSPVKLISLCWDQVHLCQSKLISLFSVQIRSMFFPSTDTVELKISLVQILGTGKKIFLHSLHFYQFYHSKLWDFQLVFQSKKQSPSQPCILLVFTLISCTHYYFPVYYVKCTPLFSFCMTII